MTDDGGNDYNGTPAMSITLAYTHFGVYIIYMAKTTLYHGSKSEISEVTATGLFEGIFAAATRCAAKTFGDIGYVVDIADSEILSHYAMSYELDADRIYKVLAAQTDAESEDELDAVYEAVTRDGAADDVRELLYHAEDEDEDGGWEIQRLRGVIAREFGYKAVECKDEYGISYLCLPGCKIRKAGNDE
jgi:hypothetical protein